jgi:general stress protein 26
MARYAHAASALSQRDVADFEVLRDIVDRIKVAMLVTADEYGLMHSRPVQTLDFDQQGNLWFFTAADSGKVHELDQHQGQINLSYADPNQQDYASISGYGQLLHDTARIEALWTKWAELWFPKGPTDPNLLLLKVSIEHAQYWDAPGSTVGRLWGLTKALLTGDKSEVSNHPHQYQ